MGILDEAIKEHLELKRQHGAGESELKQLEDEAFGPAERPGDEEPASDALAEAPTEFMAQPDLAEADGEEAPSGRRPMPQVADLQEAPEQEEAAPEAEPEPDTSDAESDASVSHTTEERQAIAEQPTEMYDIEEELGAQELEAPTEEELIEQEVSEPRLAPVDPLASVEDAPAAEVEVTDAREESDADLDDEFWDEKRLSDELDQALEAPSEPEDSSEPDEPAEPEAPTEPDNEASDLHLDQADEPAANHEDVLEDTPDFLEEAPEDDQLWFEQKPPKDFDFDD
jgi:hypothetical protein